MYCDHKDTQWVNIDQLTGEHFKISGLGISSIKWRSIFACLSHNKRLEPWWGINHITRSRLQPRVVPNKSQWGDTGSTEKATRFGLISQRHGRKFSSLSSSQDLVPFGEAHLSSGHKISVFFHWILVGLVRDSPATWTIVIPNDYEG